MKNLTSGSKFVEHFFMAIYCTVPVPSIVGSRFDTRGPDGSGSAPLALCLLEMTLMLCLGGEPIHCSITTIIITITWINITITLINITTITTWI